MIPTAGKLSKSANLRAGCGSRCLKLPVGSTGQSHRKSSISRLPVIPCLLPPLSRTEAVRGGMSNICSSSIAASGVKSHKKL
ncbi:hypothetical protein ZHAS_00004426 [Anopheles sinensis]|uniref:Uncharacterized protein n=1 Tax=Anopheles sinensis TaxID=74873 RepID=A0A084VGW9_ANOSI|nr:hypothetical protein ZHAS_00004426 [Anopheles sinensis]